MRALAIYLRRRYDVWGVPSDQDIERMVKEEGIVSVEQRDTPGRLRASLIEDHVVLKTGLTPEWQRWLTVHETVHHIIGEGAALYLVQRGLAEQIAAERRAEIVTGYFFLGGEPSLTPAADTAELAKAARIPEECVERWRTLVLAGDGPPDVGGYLRVNWGAILRAVALILAGAAVLNAILTAGLVYALRLLGLVL